MEGTQASLPGIDEPSMPTERGDAVSYMAVSLAVTYSDKLDVPARCRRDGKKRKPRKSAKKDLLIEERFQREVAGWRATIQVMLGKLEAEQAWRFLHCSPLVAAGTERVTQCQDFIRFFDYFELRRDGEECNDDELGRLATLSTSFQRAVEARLESR